MLNWAIGFIVLGVIAGLLGISGITGAWTFEFLAAFFVLLLTGVMLLVVSKNRRKGVFT